MQLYVNYCEVMRTLRTQTNTILYYLMQTYVIQETGLVCIVLHILGEPSTCNFCNLGTMEW